MSRLIISLLIFCFMPFFALADTVTYTPYGTNDSVTAVNLNGRFTNIGTALNGGLDNNNANTTSGYRFFETKSSLPTAGSQGRVVFLTTNNSLNFDSGSAWSAALTVAGTPVQGDVMYYSGSGWVLLTAGTSGKFLKTQGSSANPTWANVTDLTISSQATGDVLYYNGANWVRLAAGTTGQVLNTGTSPSWANSLSSVADYGTSASASTARQGTAIKVAYGTLSIAGSSNSSLSNLPFSSATTYALTCSFATATDATEACVGTHGSGSAATLYNNDNNTQVINWIAIGT